MFDVDVTFVYSMLGRVHFDGIRNVLDFINIIELWSKTGYTDYHRIMIMKLSVQIAVQDLSMQ